MSSFGDINLCIPSTSKAKKQEVKEVSVVIIDKQGTMKSLKIKDFKEEELYKKCGFKKADGFAKQTDWNVKLDGVKYVVSVYAKTEGTANNENKYDFPPPIDTTLFFGSCAIVCKTKILNVYTTLTVELWNKMWEKLFGGFEDLALTCAEDDAEIDELDFIPASKKTKQGYLKDGFVVDSDESEHDSGFSSDSGEPSEKNEEADDDGDDDGDGDGDGEDMKCDGSELSEDEYDYSDEDE
jgi:hypothetical protein